MKRIILLAALCPVLCLSCTKPGSPSLDENSLRLEKQAVSSTKGSCFVYVNTPGEWTLSLEGDASWAGLSRTSGKGVATSILTYEENREKAMRSLTVILSSPGSANVKMSFRQDAFADEPQPPSGLHPDKIASWMELPAASNGDGRYFFTHDMTLGSKKVRSWSFLLDISAKVAVWVAYPLNRSLIGSGSRTDNWGLDPKVPEAYQPVINKAFSGGYERGHQLPSADRLTYNANVQTFYGTNMTPQRGALNEQAWASLETRVRDWSYQFDTLYVVTGADIAGSTEYATDNVGKKVTVPVGYFKALLGYKRSATIGITGSTGGYTGIAFYFEHRGYSSSQVMNQAMTIDALEKKLGYDFFVNLPAVIGNEKASTVESTSDPWWFK